MIKNEPIIGVNNVKESLAWYVKLLNCKDSHGGNEFEMLVDKNGDIFLCLHKWGEHEHPTLLNPSTENGNGLILYLRVENFNTPWDNAKALNAKLKKNHTRILTLVKNNFAFVI